MRALGRRASGERLKRMHASPQWRGGRFANVAYRSVEGQREAMPLRDFFCPAERRTPLAPLPTVDPRGEWERSPRTGIRATWLGHSTTLLEIGGLRILTDPVWGDRASPSRRVGPRRFQSPPVPIDHLPELDLIVLSHDHYDHLDYPTIKLLASTNALCVAPLGVGAHLESWGVAPERITELDWWETVELTGDSATITATPARHFSGRTPGSANHTLWASFVIESTDGSVYYGGDSGMMPGFGDIGRRLGPFDLVLLEIGAYHPAWGDIHLGPVNALAALEALGGGPLLPVHWGMFDLATHRWDQPIEVLTFRAAESGARLLTPRLGEPVEPVGDPGPEGWWREVSKLHGGPPDVADGVVDFPDSAPEAVD